MPKSGLKHIDVGPELSKTEWESEESHELIHGTSFPSSPVERQLFYRDDEHKWYIYNGTEWVWLGGGSGGGMEVHGNEYHDPDFEQAGVAASLVETHRTSQTHTQPQPPAEHGNEKHNPDFASEAALASHAAATTGMHGAGSSHLALFGAASTLVSRVVWKDAADIVLDLSARTASIDWTDLDLTSYTSANAKLALLQVKLNGEYGTSGDNVLRIRKNGTSETKIYLLVPSSRSDYDLSQAHIVLGLDSGQVMEYKLEVASNAVLYVQIICMGYIE
jgi:hypothetical protein